MKVIYSGLLAGLLATTPTINQDCSIETDNDGDGVSQESGLDCDDNDPTVYTGANELCDSKDNDCDGEIDEEAIDAVAYYVDQDGDGFGSGEPTLSCEGLAGMVDEGGDCVDSDPSIFPGAEETLGDAIDTNCNGHLDYVVTIAGSGTAGYGGDDGDASTALLSNPFCAVAGLDGSIFIADSSNHRVRKVDADGIITTYVGTGSPGFSGDGGPAVNAQLNFPRGLVVDDSGNLYVSDSSNHRIRYVDGTTLEITTFAGNGVPGFGGDGGDPTGASMAYPYGIALASDGALFIADSNNHRVRKVADGSIRTAAGSGSSGFDGDGGLATDALLSYPRAVSIGPGNTLFIADTSNYRIRMVDTEGIIWTAAGSGIDGYGGDGGPAIDGKLNDPYGVAADTFGNLFIADTNSHRIRRVSDGIIDTVAGNGLAGYSGDGVEGGAQETQFQLPYTTTLTPNGDLLVADSANAVIRRIAW